MSGDLLSVFMASLCFSLALVDRLGRAGHGEEIKQLVLHFFRLKEGTVLKRKSVVGEKSVVAVCALWWDIFLLGRTATFYKQHSI